MVKKIKGMEYLLEKDNNLFVLYTRYQPFKDSNFIYTDYIDIIFQENGKIRFYNLSIECEYSQKGSPYTELSVKELKEMIEQCKKQELMKKIG